MPVFDKDSCVWVKDDVQAWMPGRVLEAKDTSVEVELSDGLKRTITGADFNELEVVEDKALEGVTDMIQLDKLNEGAILHTLRARYARDEIYTYVSSILVSVNPYKLLRLYTPAVIEQYQDPTSSATAPPHIFKLADNAFRNLFANGVDQAIIISGESGAGKTEATKVALEYLAEQSGGTGGVEEQILQANPIMESFGNAKTLRNNNSSRFGKWIEVQFGTNGHVVGGKIEQYLLEKSRVVTGSKGERSYNIFYQLCDGASEEEKKMLHLADHAESELLDKKSIAAHFRYLNQTGVLSIEGTSDKKLYEEMRAAMTTCEISQEQQIDILKVTAGILHLGNVDFEVVKNNTEEDGSKVSDEAPLKLSADLLGADVEELKSALTTKVIGTHTVVVIQQGPEEAEAARDALAKATYGRLFAWLIEAINECFKRGSKEAGGGKRPTIGVLDIFGFEVFDLNSFEQLCINFCNEKLQNHFNQHIFHLEQAEYKAEDISVGFVEFVDNQETIDLIEKRPQGVIPLLDEEVMVGKRGSDSNFLQKITDAHNKKHPSYGVPVKSSTSFTISHYAGKVDYDTTGFLEKNKDQLFGGLETCMAKSNNSFVAELFQPKLPAEGGGNAKGTPRSARGPKAAATLGGKFKEQLTSLMSTIQRTEPHFIRCVKPNPKKAADCFEGDMVLRQLRYSGMLEAIKVRQSGYPFRTPHATFNARYRLLAPEASGDPAAMAANIAESATNSGVLVKTGWVVGKTKLFMKADQQAALEAARDRAMTSSAIKIQSHIRGKLIRKNMGKLLAANKAIMQVVDSQDEALLLAALDQAEEAGLVTKVVTELKARHKKIKRDREARYALKEALDSHDIDEINIAIARCEELGLPEVAAAKTRRDELVAEAEALSALRKAVYARNIDQLNAAISKIPEIPGIDKKQEAIEAIALRDALVKEVETSDKLKAAVAARELSQVESALALAKEIGLDTDLVREAQSMFKRLAEESAVLKELDAAIASNDKTKLTLALKRPVKMGFTHQKVDEAQALIAKIEDDERKARESAEKEASKAAQLAESEKMLRDAIDKAKQVEASDKEFEPAEALQGLFAALTLTASNRIETSTVEAAKEMIKRLGEGQKAVERLKSALAAEDLDDVREALDQVLSLDLKIPQIGPAKEMVLKLAEKKKAEDMMKGAKGSKKKHKGDVDVEKLEVAIQQSAGVMNEADIEKAKVELETANQQNKAREQLATAVATENEQKLKDAVEAAGKVGLTYDDDDYKQASDMLDEIVLSREKERIEEERAKQSNRIGKRLPPPERLSVVRSSNEFTKSIFETAKYPNLRTREEFAKGKLFGAKALREGMLYHSKDSIPTSLTKLEPALSKEATKIFKNIMGYMGDKTYSYPEMLAQEVLQKGLDEAELRDEIYIQLAKQVSVNPKYDRLKRGWQLLCLCLKTFPPSSMFENYLLHFLHFSSQLDNEIGDIAKSAVYRCLESIHCGQAEAVPDEKEIVQWNEHIPSYISVSLPNQTAKKLFAENDVTVGELSKHLSEECGLKDSDFFALQLEIDGTRRALEKEELVCDLSWRWNEERRGKSKATWGENDEIRDEIIRPLYYQLREDTKFGLLPVLSEEEGVACAALAMNIEGLNNINDLTQFIETFIPFTCRTRMLRNQWKTCVEDAAKDMPSCDTPEDVAKSMRAYVETLSSNKYFFCSLFEVHQREHKTLPDHMIIAFNNKGVKLLDPTYKEQSEMDYMHVLKWGGSSNKFALIGTDQTIRKEQVKITVQTPRGEEMAGVINDYVAAIIAKMEQSKAQ